MSTVYDNKKNVEFLDGGMSTSSEVSQSAVAQPVKANEELILKSATKPLKVLIAFTRPLITEFADNLNLKHPLLPTISPYPTM